MTISAFFTNRPIGTTLLALGVGIFGIVAFGFLPVAPLPQIEFPTISVSAALPGASPETMATSVATPLERQLGQIAGVKELTSVSKLGSMRITVQFDLNRDINGAARDVQAAILAARSHLPTNLPAEPNYRIVNPADAPIMIIALTSKMYSRGQMYDIASSILQQKFSQVDGVGQVVVGGSSLPAVRVELNPDALNQYNISLADVRTAITNTNVNQPKGQLKNHTHTWEIMNNDQMFDAKSFKPVIVSYKNNAPVRLMDVGDVIDSVEDLRNAGIADGQRSVVLVIFKEPGSNIIETVDRLYKALDEIKATIPAVIDLTVTMDRTETIRSSLAHVEITLLLSIFLVIGVIYFFLGNARAALIPSIVIPLTILGTFGIMYLCNFSLNNLSLMALTISTGFIVDDAVVVLENIERYIEAGMKPFKAAILGAKEVTFTVLSMSTSLIAVFIPILLMGGVVGRLFREFAFTLSIAILVSLVVSLTVTPMMTAKILKPQKKYKKKPSFSGTDWLKGHYRTTLKWALRHQKLMLILTGATIVLNICLFIIIPKGFFPLQDTGRIVCSIQTQQDMSFTELEKKLNLFVDIIRQDPAVNHVSGYAGGTNAIGNAGSLFLALKPKGQRNATVFEVIDRLRKKLSTIPGATLYMQASQDIVIGGRGGNALFQYTLSSYDLPVLNKWVPLVQAKLAKLPGMADLNSDQLNNGLEVYLTYDRDTISRFNVTPQQIDAALYDAFGQRQVSTMYTAMNQYHVVMEVAPKYWRYPDTLRKIFVTNTSGQSIPLSMLARFAPSSTLVTVNHQGQFPAATLSFNLLQGFSLGNIVDDITKAVDEMKLPQGSLQGTFRGTAQAFQQSLASEPYLIMTALLVIFIVLGILYESTIHPWTILSTLPSAGVGALLALMLAGMELSIIGLIGILLLIGIVKKNAIMMIDFAVEIRRRQNKTPVAAIYHSCLLRFRPIMMTTMAALFGAIPLALESGVGSELRKPLGISIIGGLIISQILTLYTTPVIYLSLEKLSVRIKHLWKMRLGTQRFGVRSYE
jgi:multidrug efflux pump